MNWPLATSINSKSKNEEKRRNQSLEDPNEMNEWTWQMIDTESFIQTDCLFSFIFFLINSTIWLFVSAARFSRINHQFNDRSGIRIVHISIARHAFRAKWKKKMINLQEWMNSHGYITARNVGKTLTNSVIKSNSNKENGKEEMKENTFHA